MELEGARCLITGCSSGIGRALAIALADAGAHLFASARNRDAIADLARSNVELLELDVTDDQQIRRAVAAAEPLDVVINNAGYGLLGAIEEIEDEELFQQYDVNVFGVWRMCRAALPGMRSRRAGTIVNISSFGGQVPFPGIGAYRSSKFAVECLSWTLHLEVAHFGIRVLDVQPGLVETDFSIRSNRFGSGMGPKSPYEPMRVSAEHAYPRMSPSALAPSEVAEAVVAELRTPSVPLRLRIGEDTERMIAAVEAGDAAYERYVVEDLGFDWHPLGREP
jgi:NAD(P)-dependent dehydrogenase (short-subunit alcohol dehydrogenase family)